jgi:hypothetical protein
MNLNKLDVKKKNTNLYCIFHILFIRNQRKNRLPNKYRFRPFSSLATPNSLVPSDFCCSDFCAALFIDVTFAESRWRAGSRCFAGSQDSSVNYSEARLQISESGWFVCCTAWCTG